ncbi:nuclear transport factor 2 family protein [Streptomyces sp. NPDC056192]|uniref:nuclear transport factor 2 family protein n=1 Tax=unclassified Streptomyces TaxID=2593676 RepID=UPI0035D5682B
MDALRQDSACPGAFEPSVPHSFSASGRAYMSEVGRGRDGRGGMNYAIYHDRYQRTGEGWKFAARVCEVRCEDASPPAGSPPRPAEDS